MILERFKVPEKDQVLVSEAALRRTVTQIFEKLGVSPEDSAEGADVLTMTDLRGVETHGVSNMLRAYVRDYKAGKLDPRPGWRVVRESPGTAVIDAERRLGVIVGPKAMRLAVEKARTVGVGVVTVYNSGHFGAIGHYAMQAATQNMVGVCFTGAGLSVVPTFASKPLLGTNPIALAAPARREAPMLFDAATSAIAGNKIRLAMRIGSPLLAGWVTDKDGTASTMASMAETLGMTLPGNAAIPAADSRRMALAEMSGRRIMEMVREDLKPSKVLTREAFDNAIRTDMASGGSTNAIIHLVAMAGRAGVDLPLTRFDELSRTTPMLLNVRPSGKYLMEDFFYAGGL